MKVPRTTPGASADLGPAWAGSSVNCVPFRHRAIVPVDGGYVVAFYDAEGRVVLQRLDGALALIRRLVVASPIQPHDAHTCISLEQDPEGYLHAIFGAHASTAYHVRVPAALDTDPPLAAPLGMQLDGRFTYPTLIRQSSSGELLLLYREGGPWRGALRVKRWRQQDNAFADDPTPLLSGETCQPGTGPYINRPVVLADGRMAFFLVWRLAREASSAGDVVNMGLDLVMTDAALRTLHSFDGVELARPVTPVHSPRVWAVPMGAGMINQGAAAVGPGGAPVALTYWNDAEGVAQYYIVWHEATGWRATAISRFRTRFALRGRGTLPLPHSRPELLIRPDGTALCLFRSTEYSNRLMVTLVKPPYDDTGQHRTILLLNKDLGHYEPIVDHETFDKEGALVVYVQWCHQDQGDAQRRRKSVSARLVRWPAQQIESWMTMDNHDHRSLGSQFQLAARSLRAWIIEGVIAHLRR